MKESPSSPESTKGEEGTFYHLNGSSFGPVPREHIARLWQTGSIPDETLVFIAESSTWEPVTTVFSGLSKLQNLSPSSPKSSARDRISKETKEKPVFRRAESSEESEEEKEAVEQSPQAKMWQKAFIILLLVCAAGIGAIFFWVSAKVSETESLRARADNLQNLIAEKDSTIRNLRDSTRTQLEPNEIQGRFILNSTQPKSGAKVALFRRAEIEKFLKETLSKIESGADETAIALNITNNLPFPLASTATDSEGFYRLEIPEPGEFILHTNIVGDSSKTLVWFLAFSPDDPQHGPIHFTEKNASNLLSPDFAIVEAR